MLERVVRAAGRGSGVSVAGLSALLGLTSACSGGFSWPGAGDGAPPVKWVCEPGPLAALMLDQPCAPLEPLVPAVQSEHPCAADVFDGSNHSALAFDAGGNVIAPHGFRYAYRADGNVDHAEVDPAEGALSIRYAYDDAARLVGAEVAGPAQAIRDQLRYEWSDGNLVRERSLSGRHNEYLYDGGRVAKIASLGGPDDTLGETAVVFSYDGYGRRESEAHIMVGQTTAHFEYGYDHVGRLNEIRSFDPSDPTHLISLTTRTYDDPLDRLVEIDTDRDLDGVPDQRVRLRYDCASPAVVPTS